MNPPAALHGAMGRERKPFTYLPGGLDLSQIKSEKMAKRLMRNAMNEGVPERPVQNVQSPTTPTTPIPVPNFNCLPVQVFPTFQLPANPKSLLRTRSIPNQHKDPVLGPNQQNTFKNSTLTKEYNNNVTPNNNKSEMRPVSLYSQVPNYTETENLTKSVETVRPVSFNPYEFNNANNGNEFPSMQRYSLNSDYNNDNTSTNNGTRIENLPYYTQNITPDKKETDDSKKSFDAVRHVEFNPQGFSANNNNQSDDLYSKQYNLESNFNEKISPAINVDIKENTQISLPNIVSKENDNNFFAKKCAEAVDLSNQNVFEHLQSNNRQINNKIPLNSTINDNINTVPTNSLLNTNELQPLLPSEIIKIRAKSQEKNIDVNNKNSALKETKTDKPSDIFAYEEKINDSIAELQSIDKNNDVFSINTTTNGSEKPTTQNDQSEVKTTVTSKKHVTKQTKTEQTIKEGENDAADTEAELTVQLPSKKPVAKTETKVEIVKKILPDGGVEEVKTTTTTTTVDGRTEIKTRTETKIIPKETEEEEEEEKEEEYEEEEEETGVQVEEIKQNGHKTEEAKEQNVMVKEASVVENDRSDAVITKEERSESTTTKNITVSSTTESNDVEEIQEGEEEEEEEEEEVEVEEEIVQEEEKPKPPATKPPPKPQESVEEEEVQDEKEEETIEREEVELKEEVITEEKVSKETKKVESEVEEEVGEEIETHDEETTETLKQDETEEEGVEEEEEYEEAEEEVTEVKAESETVTSQEKVEADVETQQTNETPEAKETVEEREEPKVASEPPKEPEPTSETTPSTRNIPIVFDKVEDIEIKPIGPASEAISRTRTESTEIITSKDNLGGPISTQTELHRVENIVVENRITKTLDHSYEQMSQGLPTVKTYFAPTREPISTSPQPAKPFQSSYTDPNERRHSLLLDRLSVERQMPPQEQYQIYNNSTYETQNQYQEPQSEVLTVSNVKPSMITNQQWYQQTKKENVIFNNVSPSSPKPAQQWNQDNYQYQSQTQTPSQAYQPPSQPQYTAPPQPQYQPPSQPQYQPPSQPQYQSPVQQQYQAPTQPQYQAPAQPQYQAPTQPQYQAPTQPQYQPPSQPHYQAPPQVPQYQPIQTPQYQPQNKPSLSTYQPPSQPTSSQQTCTDSYSSNYSKSSNTFQQNSYPSHTLTPSTWGPSNDLPSLSTQNNQYSFLNKESTDSFKQKTQDYSSTYVPPPWEQDSSNYVSEAPQTYYQPPQQTLTQNATPAPAWKPPQSQSKFSKPTPTAYVPPAPNQSFVKPLSKSEAQNSQGRKTYYSEYERRYISVPETMYVPGETKYQPQPDPSPQYYYDNDEAAEKEEHAWRKELREFTEKSSQTQYSTESVKPPWEGEQAYPKPSATPVAYTPTPTWSQTLRPRSSRERTFESDYGSQEWPKTNTIGRGRPLSTYAQSNVTRKVERTRGISVDRYNPNSYKSPIPMEHPPVQSHTLTPASAPPIKFHANPNVPAYHNSRASAEPREQSASYQQNPRSRGDSRDSPLQSRSFKYLQWITGTDE